MAKHFLPPYIQDNYQVEDWNHATAILERDFPDEWRDICDVLMGFTLKKSHILKPGGRKSQIAEELDSALYRRGWLEKQFSTLQQIDGSTRNIPTHSIDCYKNRIGVEIEWNNKDPFFDRDLNNFRLLFDLKAISVGVIVTRCSDLQAIFDHLGRGSSFGASTTHFNKLLPKLQGGGAGGCPVLVLGISDRLYVDDLP